MHPSIKHVAHLVLNFLSPKPQCNQRITSPLRDPDIKPRSCLMLNIDSYKCILFISNASQAGRAGYCGAGRSRELIQGHWSPDSNTQPLRRKSSSVKCAGFNASPVPQDSSCLNINNIQRLKYSMCTTPLTRAFRHASTVRRDPAAF